MVTYALKISEEKKDLTNIILTIVLAVLVRLV